MENPSKNLIVSTSSPWVSATLNILPGLGTGYIYQRRWKAYWTTVIISILWLLLGLIRQQSIDLSDPAASVNADDFGFYGILFIALITAAESALNVINLRKAL